MAVHDFRSQRLFVHNALAEGSGFEASREQANYLLNVLRIADGGSILIFNGKDGEWLSRIEATGRKKCNLVPIEQVRTQPEKPKLDYIFAPLKQARLDYMVQKAVEMGAGTLQPVITQFTQVRSINQKRLLANAIEAAEQCGVLTVPKIHDPLPLMKINSAYPESCEIVFCDEAEHALDSINAIKQKKPDRIAVLVGPEGGFSEDERSHLKALPNVTSLGLGPRILRADTASVAALAIIQANLGDWYKNE